MEHGAGGAGRSAIRRLGDAVGIVPKYLDQTGKEWRETKPAAYRAILATLGIDASSEAAAERALRAIRAESRRELVAPVRVVEVGDQTAARHVPVRLASPPRSEARWQVELETENGELRREEGSWDGRSRSDLVVPWPDGPRLGYHRVRVTVSMSGRGGERTGEQSLIVVPSRCVTPADLLGERKAVGIIANLYTLRSARNWGVGDFTDLAELVGRAAAAGASFVGLNPLHALLDRGESISPYSPVSRLFRNPIYVDVTAAPELRLVPHVLDRIDRPELQAELTVLREAPHVHYERVMAVKAPVLEELHAAFLEREQRSRSARARAYEEFVQQQGPELERFATWMALDEERGARGEGRGNWRDWPAEYRQPESDTIRQFRAEHARRVEYHKWVQFELDEQLGEAARRARAVGMPIGLYQDLAIGSSPGGADVWAQQQLFVQGASVGAPPDPYSATGQNWGLPPIDPRALRRDGYRYFIRLVQNGFRHAGALRIDHVMGLFRLFWIPEGHTGKDGAFVSYPAADLLGIIALESVRQRALVVGEDLGTVPQEVPPALQKWGVLSSKVLYFEREKAGDFKPASCYPELALATANTHDMATLAGFWKGRDIDLRAKVGLIEGDEAAAEAREQRERDKTKLLELLAAEHFIEDAARPPTGDALRSAIHDFLASTPAALVGLALDDLAGEEEAVNLPGVGPDRYPSWTRKMGQTIEEILRPVPRVVRPATERRRDASEAGRRTEDAASHG